MTFRQAVADWGAKIEFTEEMMYRLCDAIDLFERAKTDAARKALSQAAMCLMLVILSEIDP